VHLTVRVDGQEPLDRLWEPVNARAAQARQGDDALGRDRPWGTRRSSQSTNSTGQEPV